MWTFTSHHLRKVMTSGAADAEIQRVSRIRSTIFASDRVDDTKGYNIWNIDMSKSQALFMTMGNECEGLCIVEAIRKRRYKGSLSS